MILLAICLDCRLRLVVGISATYNGKLMTLTRQKFICAYSPRVLSARTPRESIPPSQPSNVYAQQFAREFFAMSTNEGASGSI